MSEDSTPKMLAHANFEQFYEKTYPGRVIVIGLDQSGENYVVLYAIMGRSEGSRNRIFISENNRLFTELADPSKGGGNSLTIYNAMDTVDERSVVSNGNHTDIISQSITTGVWLLDSVLNTQKYEPDPPNFTPRIAGICSPKHSPTIQLAILKKSPWSSECQRFFFKYPDVAPGFGYCIHTYEDDDNPLPPFSGEPILVPLIGDKKNILAIFWDALNKENRVSIAAKFIPRDNPDETTIHVINKYEKVR